MAKTEKPPETEGEEDGAAPKKGGGKLKLILMIGLPAVVVILGAAAALLLLGGGKKDEHAEDEHGKTEAHADASGGHGEDHGDGHGDEHHDEHVDASHVVFYTMPDLLVNLQTDSGQPTYLKLKLTLEVDSAETVAAIEPAMPRVLDRFQGFLRELRVEDLSGSQGSYRLRLELLRRVNLAEAPHSVRAVLIEEMLIQ